MKTVTKKLLKFLELVNVSGTVEIRECIIESSKESLQIYAKIPSNTFALKAILKGDFSELETIGVDDLALFKKVVSLNKDIKEVEITKKENTIVFKGKNTKTKLLLRNPKYIMTTLDGKDYEEKRKLLVGNSFTLRKEDINQLSQYYDVMKGKIYISGKDNVITFKMGVGENSSEVSIEVDEKVEAFEVAIAGFFLEALNQIADDVTVNVKTDMPVIITSISDDYEIEYLVAPLKRTEE